MDQELERLLGGIDYFPVEVKPNDIAQLRKLAPKAEDVIDESIEHEERTVPGVDGNRIRLSIFRPKLIAGPAGAQSPTDNDKVASKPRCCIYYMHGGGMVIGNEISTVVSVLPWIQRYNAVAISVDYRLAPEHADPAPIEDCYSGLMWVDQHKQDLGIDRIVIAGVSAGGGLCAGLALLCRDRGTPLAHAQVLMCPMIDDKNDSLSTSQFVGVGTWSPVSNETGWNALLGDRRGTAADVSIYAAPARARDLSGLPATWIDVGSNEIFRDESIEYANRLWACGVSCELHVWPGAFHGFDLYCPNAQLSIQAKELRTASMRRFLT